MPKFKEPFTLLKRKTKKGRAIYYYRLADDPRRVPHSTGKLTKHEANEFVKEMLEKKKEDKKKARTRTLGKYIKPFFIWDRCPHVRRLLEEGKSIGKTHVSKSRRWLELYVFPDAIMEKGIASITRDDLLKYRTSLIEKLGGKRNTANKVMSSLKTVFHEALFRQVIKFDPTSGIGNIKETRKEPGIFSPAELAALFPSSSLGPWQDCQDYTCFLLAATTGMRRGEILALEWRHIDFDKVVLRVDQAWKNRTELDDPKWGKKRVTPLPEVAVRMLHRLHDDSIRTGAEELVFCYDDGSRLGATWWQKRFVKAIDSAGIDRVGRDLKPHSFRHSLNTFLRDSEHDPAKIRAALGWTNDRTQDNYTHWNVDHLREQADSVDKLFAEKED